MNFILNSFLIDVIFLCFCFLFSIVGYFKGFNMTAKSFSNLKGITKGFIKRAYDFLGTILAIIFSYCLCDTVSQLYDFVPDNELIQNNIFMPILNKIITFIVLFIIFWILKKILGFIIKPLIQGIVSFLSLTDFLNKLLGFMFSFIEALVISYIILIFMMTPLVDNGYNLINNTILAKRVLEIVPEVSSEIADWSQDYVYLLDNSIDLDNQETIEFLIKTYQLNLLTDEQMKQLIENDLKEYLMNDSLKLQQWQRDILIQLIDQTNLTDNEKLRMKNKVSE